MIEETLYVCAICEGDVDLLEMTVDSEVFGHCEPGMDHAPIPVLRADQRTCEFCGMGMGSAPFVFRCLPHDLELFGELLYEDIDRRLACNTCRRDVEANRWQTLEQRAGDVFKEVGRLAELPYDKLYAIQALLGAFRKNWDENPATPAPLEEAS